MKFYEEKSSGRRPAAEKKDYTDGMKISLACFVTFPSAAFPLAGSG
jgi:hypothetical protein